MPSRPQHAVEPDDRTATPDRPDQVAQLEQLDRLERALSAISRALAARHALEDLAVRSGHRMPQASWTLLEAIGEFGPLRVSAIAECYGADISTVTPRIQSLERAGLVVRSTAATDGRVSMIDISPHGQAALEAVHAARRDVIAEALEGSPCPSPAAIDEIVTSLHQIANALTAPGVSVT